jgi:glycosyltransferase involved in cell wall biosynthesis
MTILLLFTHRWRAGQAGGAETHVINLIRGMSRRGHQVVFVTGAAVPAAGASPEPVAAHYQLPFQTLDPRDKFKAWSQLEEIVLRHAPQLIHAHHRTGGYYAEWMCRRHGIPYVVTVHDPWLSAPLKRFHGKMFRRLIAVSEFIRQGVIRRFHFPPEAVKTIHNGVDPARFAGVVPEDALRFRNQYGVRPDEVVLSLVGRISRIKGHYDLIDALRLLPRDLNYQCLIVGEGKPRKHLENLVAASGLRERVTFCGYRPDIPVVMAGSDVVLLPSYREPFGLTLVEAMLSHKPVIASDMGGIPEIVTHNRDGLLVEPGNVTGLAQSIGEMVSDQQLRLRLSTAGYQTACNRFLLPTQIDATEAHYHETMGNAIVPFG